MTSRPASAARRGMLCVLAVTTAMAVLAAVAEPAGAQSSPTAQFRTVYRAHMVWDDWKWWQRDKCTQRQPVYGSEPSAPGRYPVVVYLHGMLADWSGNREGRRVARLAARHGFVAAAFTFDSWPVLSVAAVDGNARCMFGPDPDGSALAAVCARPKADCARGIAVIGFSVGGAIAARAGNSARNVRAAWLLGVDGPVVPEALAAPAGSRALPDDRIRIAVGGSDDPDTAALNRLTGRMCSASPCLGADGSGYHVVADSEVADGVADHCWWQAVTPWSPASSCTPDPRFDPGFLPPSTRPWALGVGLDWLERALDPR